LTLVVAAARLLPGTVLRGRAALLAATAVVAVVCVANLPSHVVPAGPTADRGVIPVVRELRAAMAALEGGGPYVIDMEGIRFAEPFSGPVMSELRRRGIPFVADDEGMVRQLGPSRRADGGEARLLVRDGAGSLEAPDGSELAVLVRGLDEAEQRELDQLDVAVADHLRARGDVPLNDRGRDAVDRGDLPAVQDQPALLVEDPERFVDLPELVYLVEEDLLALDPGWQQRFDRWAALTTQFREGTVALFVVPATDADAG
jgi:hypothetical protein